MAFTEGYRQQVELLVRLLPFVAAEDCFAMKGGTAINLFFRDLPRLSVDIDLTYLPVQERAPSLADIEAALTRIGERITVGVRRARVTPSRTQEGAMTKLIARSPTAQVKIEVTPVLRGCVFEPERRSVSQFVEAEFGFAEMRIVSFADLYAGKILAALDRQHPRDLFDIRDLLRQEGVNDDLRRAFLVYLISHPRPMHEVLACREKDLVHDYTHGFAGMARTEVELAELLQARRDLVTTIVGEMPTGHRRFLLDFKRGDRPDWGGLELTAAEHLPAVQWRRLNLDRLQPAKRAELARNLEAVLLG